MSLVAWLYQGPSRELALLPVNRTVTNGPPPHGQSCKRWTKLAGKTPVREPSPSMKPTWGCRKRVQGSASLSLRYQPQNFFPAQIHQGLREAKPCDTLVEPSQPSPMHTWGRSPPSMPPRKTQFSEENWRGKRTKIWSPAPVCVMVTHPDLLILLPCHHDDLTLGEGQLSCLVSLAVSHCLYPLLLPLGLKWDEKGVADPPQSHPKGGNRDTAPSATPG